MARKIKMTKVELKAQREALQRFTRYLPTLQLKKQQLQLEVQRIREERAQLLQEEKDYWEQMMRWIYLLDDDSAGELERVVVPAEWKVRARNIAGVDVPTFEALTFTSADLDLFTTPMWYDDIIRALEKLTEFALKRKLLEEQLAAVEDELRVTTQRVNLFEKVKIPEAQENIRRIQIFLGDQQAFAVGRAKIAKAKAATRRTAWGEQ